MEPSANIEKYDVIVVGGSSAGVAAAEAAAREGAATCLVESRPYLGSDIAGKLRLDAPFRQQEFPPSDKLETLLARAASNVPGDPNVISPLRVKQICDRKVLDAGVKLHLLTYVTDVLRDDAGQFCGIIAANRSGPFRIEAKALIDATEFGRVAEQAGSVLSPFPSGKTNFARYSVAGEPPRLAADSFAWELADASPRSFAFAEQAARDALWNPATLDAADALLLAENRTVVADAVNVRTVGLVSATTDPNVFISNGRDAGAEMARAVLLREPSAPAAKPQPPRKEVECDVLVVGAGTAGAPAAIAAARSGAKVIVCDPLHRMGGVMTEGMIDSYCFGLRIGFTDEIDKGIDAMCAKVHGVAKAEWFRREARKAGAEIWFGAMAVEAMPLDAGGIGVLVAFHDAAQGVFVRAKTVVDATGNADVAAMLGEETEFIDGKELALQGAGSAAKILGRSYLNTDCGFVDDTDAEDMMNFALRARLSIGAYAWDQAQVVNSRERRHLHGVAYVTPQDVIMNRTYPDVIARTYSNFDTHGQTIGEQFFIEAPHAANPITVNLPYRCMLPKNVDGLLVVGLGMSAHRDAMPILRMQPDVQNQGFAAGTAAAIAVSSGKQPRDIDVRELQRQMIAKGIVDASVLEMADSFPLPDATMAQAAAALDETYRGLAELLTDPARAKKLLEGRQDLPAAHVLALLGDASAAHVLADAVSCATWDAGWNYRGMDQFGRSVSWIDSYLIALGKAKAKCGLAPLLAKMDELNARGEYSHFRAVALCAEGIGDPAAVNALKRLLELPGVGGQWMKPFAEGGVPLYPEFAYWQGGNRGIADKERSDALRELCLARALYKLGDTPEKLGQKTLEAYANDPRRAFANHARKVLEGK